MSTLSRRVLVDGGGGVGSGWGGGRRLGEDADEIDAVDAGHRRFDDERRAALDAGLTTVAVAVTVVTQVRHRRLDQFSVATWTRLLRRSKTILKKNHCVRKYYSQ